MWTVILHFDRGHVQIHKNLTAQQAEQMLHVAVFHNRDCVNANVFLQNQEEQPG